MEYCDTLSAIHSSLLLSLRRGRRQPIDWFLFILLQIRLPHHRHPIQLIPSPAQGNTCPPLDTQDIACCLLLPRSTSFKSSDRDGGATPASFNSRQLYGWKDKFIDATYSSRVPYQPACLPSRLLNVIPGWGIPYIIKRQIHLVG